jgi:hypothetical protein
VRRIRAREELEEGKLDPLGYSMGLPGLYGTVAGLSHLRSGFESCAVGRAIAPRFW